MQDQNELSQDQRKSRRGFVKGAQPIREVAVDVEVDVNVNVAVRMEHEVDVADVAEISVEFVTPIGKEFKIGDFDNFWRFFVDNKENYPDVYAQYEHNIAALRQQWNNWFAIFQDAEALPAHIGSIFISVDIIRNIKHFANGFALEHLPSGLRKNQIRAANQLDFTKHFTIIPSPQHNAEQDPFAIPLKPAAQKDVARKCQDQAEIRDWEALLSQDQRQWWQALSLQHMQQHPEDDLFVLMQSFKEFSKLIARRGLSFHTAPVSQDSFKNVTEMRTAMAYMLTLLDHTYTYSPEDLEISWQSLPHLNLGPNGAIRTVYAREKKANSKYLIASHEKSTAPLQKNHKQSIDISEERQLRPQYTAITPEMRIDSDHYVAQREAGKKYICINYGAETDKSASEDNLETLDDAAWEQHLWRSIGQAEHRNRLDFYYEAMQSYPNFKGTSENFRRIQRRRLEQLLLRMTTGAHAVQPEQEAHALAVFVKKDIA